jgi:hypothetical protein
VSEPPDATGAVPTPGGAPGAAHTPPWRGDGAVVAAVALAARLALVGWAAARIPPTADGDYYHRIADRIARGLGYTWLWPDGAVTYAAHYPIGYPGALGLLYAAFGSSAAVAMVFNSILGALAALAVHRLAARFTSRRRAAVAGALAALHPGLVFYAPALMTEGVTASLLALAVWAVAWSRDAATRGGARWAPLLVLGAVLGAATLVRPQVLLMAPAFGALAWAPFGARRAAMAAGAATVVALAVCAPWTTRNCTRLGRCALVSVNGGWNLLIGAHPDSTGSWSPVQVPEACREVWGEADKDACFSREAQRLIAGDPLRWVARAPRKLAATFDYCGAAGWYLHAAAPERFGERAKVILGAVETLVQRAMLLAALLWAGLMERRRLAGGPPASGRHLAMLLLLAIGGVATLTLHAWIGYLALAVVALARGRSLWTGPVLPAAAVVTLALTLVTHAVFFGAGRYSLVVFPLLAGVAATGFGDPQRRTHP